MGPSPSADLVERADERVLLEIAIEAISHRLRVGTTWEPLIDDVPARLREPGASFVSLERDGQLLGCVGSLEPTRPLARDVARSAMLAAFEDPRLPAVTADDLRCCTVKVSVLSALEPMPAFARDVVLNWLRPGIDGIVLAADGQRATFLPSVWSTLAEPALFLDQLLLKAGLPRQRWPLGPRAWRYTTVELVDPGPRDA